MNQRPIGLWPRLVLSTISFLNRLRLNRFFADGEDFNFGIKSTQVIIAGKFLRGAGFIEMMLI